MLFCYVVLAKHYITSDNIFSNTAPTAPMPSTHSISAARSSHSMIYILLRLVEYGNSVNLMLKSNKSWGGGMNCVIFAKK